MTMARITANSHRSRFTYEKGKKGINGSVQSSLNKSSAQISEQNLPNNLNLNGGIRILTNQGSEIQIPLQS